MSDTVVEVISISNHNKDILHQLNDYRRSDSLCDVTVVVQGREFRAHRAVLAAGGGFFAGLFAANMKEQTDNKVELNELDSDAVANVLNYIYTGDIELSSDNAQQIIMAADFLLLEKLKVAVDDYMARVVKDLSTDYFASYNFALQYKCASLEKSAMTLILNDFEAVWHGSQVFPDISLESLNEILSSDDIVVRNEEIILQAVLVWVNYQEERKQLFYGLFSKVRLCSLSTDFLYSSVVNEGLIASNPECLKLVMESIQTRWLPTTANLQHPRSCLDSYTNAILVFPLERRNNCKVPSGPWCYLPSDGIWYQIPFPDKNCKCDCSEFGYGQAFYHEGSILLISSTHKTVMSRRVSIHRFDIKTGSWSVLSSIYAVIPGQYSLVCFQGSIYFVGGECFLKQAKVTDVKVLNLASGVITDRSLTAVASLNHPRKFPSVVCNEKHIYALGGLCDDVSKDNYCQAVERYDPLTDSWVELAPMKCLARGSICAMVGAKIFRVPGLTDKECDYNEVYDIQSDTWSQISRSSCYVSRGVLALCDEKLYLIGVASVAPGTYEANKNHCNTRSFNTVTFDLKKETWSDAMVTSLESDSNNFLRLSGTSVRLPRAMIASFKTLSNVSP